MSSSKRLAKRQEVLLSAEGTRSWQHVWRIRSRTGKVCEFEFDSPHPLLTLRHRPPPRAGEVLESKESLEDDHVTCLGSMSETYQRVGRISRSVPLCPCLQTIIFTILGMVSHPISDKFQNMKCFQVHEDTDIVDYVRHSTTLHDGTVVHRFSKELWPFSRPLRLSLPTTAATTPEHPVPWIPTTRTPSETTGKFLRTLSTHA
jgi:hypothetical protein